MTDFRVNVIVDPRGAATGARRVKRELGGIETAADRVRRTMGRAFALGAGAFGIQQAVRTLSTFEQAITTVRAVTGATESEFAALREEAKRLGATTRFAASQAAEGATFLARAGFDTDEILASLNDTLLLAQAGALDLGSAADIASNVLTGFRLEAAEAGRVVDVLAKAANSSNTDVRQLGDAMKFVAPVAAGLGVSVEEAAAAVGTLSDAGLQGSLAGTGLRRVLSQLESPASKTLKIFDDLDVSAEEVRVSQVGLTKALQRLAEAGVDTGTALEIFGDRGGPAFEVLRSGIGSVEELTEKLQDADGTAREIADVMDDNLQGSLKAVASAFEAVIIAFGDAGATSGLRTGLDALASILRTVADNADTVLLAIELFLAALIANKVLAFASALRTAAAGIVALEVALGAATTRAALFSGALKGIQRIGGAAFSALLGPIGLVAGALFTLIETIKSVRGEFARLQEMAGNAVAAVNQGVRDAGDIDTVRRVIAEERAAIRDLQENGGGLVRGVLGITSKEIEERTRAVEAAEAALNRRAGAIESGARLDLGGLGDGNLLPPTATAIPGADGTTGGLGGTDLGGGGGGESAVNEALQRRSDLLRRITGDIQGLRTEQSDLVALYQSGQISAEQYSDAMRDLNTQVSALDNTFSGGLANGFDRIAQRAGELGTQVSEFVVGAFDKLTDSIVNFAQTGEFNIRQFFGSLASELLKLATNQLFSSLLNSFGGGGGLSSLFGGGGGGGFLSSLFGFQNGGSFQVGGSGGADSQLVAFRATPGEMVDIKTPGQRQQGGGDPVVVQQAPPVVNVQITPRDITQALSGSEGDQFFLRAAERNKRAVNGILGKS